MVKQFILAAFILCSVLPVMSQETMLTVEAGQYDRIQSIIQVPVDFAKIAPGKNPKNYVINLYNGENAVQAQWIPSGEDDSTGSLVFILEEALKAGHSRTYKLLASDEGPIIPNYSAERVEDDHITVFYKPSSPGLEPGPRKILQYNQGIQEYQPDPDSHLSRSGYVHPLYTPAGQIVTGDLCPDHPHQRGCFFAWTKCTHQGEEVNFWALDTGKSRTVSPPEFINGPVFSTLIAQNELLAGMEPALNEKLTYNIYGGITDGWIIDITIDHQVIDDPLQVEQYLYGGMAFRGPAAWLETPLVILSSKAIQGIDSNLTRARWLMMCGPNQENTETSSGVTYFDHPDNPRYPTHLRVHPTKPYFVFAYHQREGLHIDKKHPVQLKYRILVHDGIPKTERLKAMSQDLSHPPKVEVSK